MNSVNDPWHIDPSDLLKTNSGAELFDNVYDTAGINDFDKLLEMNPNDVDSLLTQELRDLDIPLIPQSLSNGENYNDVDSFGRNKPGVGQLQVEDPYSSGKYGLNGAMHKRGPSGTAIFGFVNHNKTLSISNLQKSLNVDLPTHSESTSDESNKLQTGNDGNLGQVLLKQQEQLRMALERQQEVNRKLEQQLQENKLQQQRLQRVLDEQEVVAHQLASDDSPQSTRSQGATRKTVSGRDDGLIITSNTYNGGFQFPPPSMISPPPSNASINGSPSRKSYRNWLRKGLDNVSPSASDFDNYQNKSNFDKKNVSVPNFSHDLNNKNHSQSSIENTMETKATSNIYKNPFCPNGLSESPTHRKKESTVSTVSTIPQHHEENSDSDSGSLLGLGIQLNRKASDGARGYSLRPPPIDIMPAIPGSSNNTPVSKHAQLPQKHTFQHTPIKTQQQQQQQQQQQHSQYISDKLFSDEVGTPQLKPPPVRISSRRSSDYASDFPDNEEDIDLDIDPDLQPDEEPESRFVVAKTPSPVLKSQGRFEGSSPQFDLSSSNNASPLKITRKPTTLPRGSIDKYVKELPDRLFECMYPSCGKIFKRRYNIRSHIQTHLEDRPYVCDFEGCDKAFVRNHDLVRHKKSHAEKSYACPCGKKFNREDALIVHRSRMICSGGKKYENVVIKKSPRRRGRPKKDGSMSVSSSPVKESVARDHDGYLMFKMEEQLRNEMEKYGLLRPPHTHLKSGTNNHTILSPATSSNHSDLETPLLVAHELRETTAVDDCSRKV